MLSKSLILFSLANLLSLTGLHAQGRLSTTSNSDWLFYKGDTTKITPRDNWKTVSIPHTWNTGDVLDDEPGYYRGDGWYKKTIYVPASWKDKTVYLYFEGAG